MNCIICKNQAAEGDMCDPCRIKNRKPIREDGTCQGCDKDYKDCTRQFGFCFTNYQREQYEGFLIHKELTKTKEARKMEGITLFVDEKIARLSSNIKEDNHPYRHNYLLGCIDSLELVLKEIRR